MFLFTLMPVDVRVPFNAEFVCQAFLFCITQIAVVCWVFPWFLVPLTFIAAIFTVLDILMNRGVLEARKLENVTKSSVLHHLSSAMAGICVIRGYRRQHVFQRRYAFLFVSLNFWKSKGIGKSSFAFSNGSIKWSCAPTDRFNDDLNVHLSAQTIFGYSNRWFTFRMNLMGLASIVVTAIFCVSTKTSLSPATAGLALANVFQTATFIPFVMRMKADFRARFNSVERVAEYAHVRQSH